MDKRLQREPALRRQTQAAPWFRHIGFDAVRLARKQRLAVMVADIGNHPQRLGAERLLRRLRHHMQLAGTCSWPVSLPSLTTSLATISLCRSSTAICTL